MVQVSGIEIADETTSALERVARSRGQSVDDVLRSLLGIDHRVPSAKAIVAGFDKVWLRIEALAGTEFATRSGQVFTYRIEGDYVSPSTSDVRIPVSQFRRAFAMGPVRGPSSLRGIFAPSIVWAVLNDPRIGASPPTGRPEPAKSDRVVEHTWPDDSGADIGGAHGEGAVR
ncbi:MAG: hypothetical protein HY682_03395 [Chloroflexi bacterium]|nr:hypothetical protein [Chloroflexota bacterium]